jgi:hypothetical protein
MRLTEADYWKRRSRLDVVSYGKLRAFMENPRAFRLGKAKERTDAMVGGLLVDCELFEPENLAERFVATDFDEWRSNDAKAQVAEIEASGRIPVKRKWLDKAHEEAQAILQNDQTLPSPSSVLLDADGCWNGESQMGIAHELLDGLFYVSKPDWAPGPGLWEDWIFDLKRVPSIDRRSWMGKVADFKYHWQAASYLDSFNAETGQNRKKFGWILVESSPPYDSGVVECPPEALDIGRAEWTDAINSYYTALTTDTWLSPLHTGFSDVPVQIGLPEWYGKASRASR